ncbi:MAG: D-lactate dehydrogenase (cytochrome) [Gammaproteobacteria bacterium]|jgi:D-lactate dehydrogenase (cytochrome)
MSSKISSTSNSIGAVIDKLRLLFGERVSTATSVLDQHGRGESWHPSLPPDAVCFAHSTEEVAQIVTLCAEHGIPIIAYGTGTSLEGQVQAVNGGICIDLSQMNAVIEVNSEDLDCRVQAGVTRRQLNQYLRDTGLFFPVDPGANTSIGGMSATRASGTNAVRYGTMRENVLGLTVVTANGDIVHTGTRARKSSAGYDLTHLFVGSEGTLGVITEITLRLYGLSESISAAIVNFPNVQAAAEATILTIQMGIPIARIELLDTTYMKALNQYSKTDYPELDTLFLEFHGTTSGVAEQVKLFSEISQDLGASGFQWAAKEEDRNKLWRARHDAYYAGLAVSPGSKGYVTDVCVPISRLAECITQTQQDIAEAGLFAPIIGHVGDGNFHCTVFIDADDADMFEKALAFDRRLVARALEMGGTCTGEHGIGMGKLKHMRHEHGDNAVNLMKTIKQALDPQNIMNPGKVVDC